MFCPECGKQLSDDSVFCEYCGARVDDEGSGAPQVQKSGSNNIIPVIIGGIILVTVVGVLLFYVMGKDKDNDSDDTAEVNEDNVAE